MSEVAKIQGYDIRDKKLADATSANDVANTDAIELKTSNGDQIYVTRDSFMNAMMNVINANTKSSVDSVVGSVTTTENGVTTTEYGSISAANLASVLGVSIPINRDYSGKLEMTNGYGLFIGDRVGQPIILFVRGSGHAVIKNDAGVSITGGSSGKLTISYTADQYGMRWFFLGGIYD